MAVVMGGEVHPVLGVEWRDPVLAPTRRADLEADAKRLTGGKVPLALGYIARSDWVARAFLDALSLKYVHADPATMQLIGLVASHENACRYCYGHRRAFMRIQGLSDARIDQLEHQLELAELDEGTRAVLEFARALARSRPRPMRAHAEALRQRGVSDGAIAEIVGEVANWCVGNRVATMLAVPPEAELEALVDSFVGKLMRPFIARQIKKSLKRVPAMPPISVADLPYGKAIEPLVATSVGRLFKNGLERAFASPVLPRRTKALIFGVVARSLGCETCEGESRRLLAAEGLDGSAIDAALDHLTAPGGDPVEQQVMSLARDSVHYRPAEIQDRTRALVDALGTERLLEAVGTAAVANAVVRVAMLQA